MDVSITMRQARQRDYALPEQLIVDAEARKRGKNTLRYIELLASQTNTDVSDWQVSKIFWNGNTGRLHDDRAKINEKFFKYKEVSSKSKDLTKLKIKFTAEEYDKFVKSFLSNSEEDKRRKAEAITSWQRSIEQSRRSIENYETSIVKTRRELEEYDLLHKSAAKSKPKEIEDIERIMDEGFFTYVKSEWVERESAFKMHFITSNVTLTYDRSTDRGGRSVFMGRYHVIYDVRRMMFLVKSGAHNPRREPQSIHPHVSGTICFGTINTSQFKTNRDTYGYFKALQHVLMNYHSGNPYTTLSEFEDSRTKYCSQWWIENVDNKLPLEYPSTRDPYEYKKDSELEKAAQQELAGVMGDTCDECGELLEDCGCDYEPDDEEDGDPF